MVYEHKALKFLVKKKQKGKKYLQDLGLGKIFLDFTPKHVAEKEKLLTWISSKFKTSVLQKFCKRVRRQTIDWEKIFANHVPDKGLISRIYKKIINTEQLKIILRKWAKEMKRHFTKEGIQVANKHMKRCSTLAFGEMYIKIT